MGPPAQMQAANAYFNGRDPYVHPVKAAGAAANNTVNPTQFKECLVTGNPSTLNALNQQNNHGIDQRIATPFGQINQKGERGMSDREYSMAKDMAEMKRSVAYLTGQYVPTIEEAMSSYMPAGAVTEHHVVPPGVDDDIPYEMPANMPKLETVNTVTTHDIVAGQTLFHVHDDRGVKAGQILSIGIEGSTAFEHVQVKAKGSVETISGIVNAYPRGTPVRLITATLRGQQDMAEVISMRNRNVANSGGGCRRTDRTPT